MVERLFVMEIVSRTQQANMPNLCRDLGQVDLADLVGAGMEGRKTSRLL